MPGETEKDSASAPWAALGVACSLARGQGACLQRVPSGLTPSAGQGTALQVTAVLSPLPSCAGHTVGTESGTGWTVDGKDLASRRKGVPAPPFTCLGVCAW